MKLDKAIILQTEIRNRILSVFHDAEQRSLTHDEILNELQSRVYSMPAKHKRAPRWLTSAMFESTHLMFHSLYYGKVVWRHVVDGVQYDDWNSLPEHGKELGRTGKLQSGHFWKHSGKPFSLSPIN